MRCLCCLCSERVPAHGAERPEHRGGARAGGGDPAGGGHGAAEGGVWLGLLPPLLPRGRPAGQRERGRRPHATVRAPRNGTRRWSENSGIVLVCNRGRFWGESCFLRIKGEDFSLL